MLGQLHQQRVVGQVRLDNHLARLFGAACAAGDLDDQLRHALAGAEVAGEQAAVGVEDRHQRHPWKVVTFGKHLRADQDARLAFLNGREQLVHRILARCAVAVDPQHRIVREQNRQALLGPFGAGANGAQIDLVALRALARHTFDVAAMVAAQLAVTLVHGHSRVTALALGHPATVMTQQGRGEAAAVEEHQYLLPGGQGLADGLLHRPGNAAVQRAAFHVQAQEARLFGAAGALVQAQQPIAAGVGVVQAFQRRGGGAEDNRNVFLSRPHQCQIAGVVAQTFLLFIGAVVLFVDDDQAGVLHRCEQGRAGADNDVGLTVPRGQPGLEAFAVIDRRMDQRDTGIETLFEARQGLRAEVDFRDQHQRLLAGLEGFADQLQIDFGLAAAGDAGQQERVITVEAGANRLIGGALLRV
ncbi:hypothetical protein D3C71_1193770 [compost metagenome]